MGYQHIEVETAGHVGIVWLNRPEKRNALSADMWADIPSAVHDLDNDDSVRVIVVAGRGPAFSVGIDINLLASLQPSGASAADTNRKLYDKIIELQETASCLANSPKPVIAAIHGYCLGAGMDLVTAADIRLASSDATFSIRETRMGLVADTGVLQRLPAIVGPGVTAEMAYTGADYDASWASEKGLVNSVVDGQDALMETALGLAETIAANSPLVTSGIKAVLAAADGQTLDEALEYVAQWNSSFLLSNDLTEAITAFFEKRDPDFTGT